MRSRPIGTKNTLTPSADRSRARAGNKPVNGPGDFKPVDIRYSGPGSRKGGSLWRWSRLIITKDALYVARSNDKGLTVASVTKYPLPEGDRVQKAGNAGSWGPFSWTSCGCANSWGRHSSASLVAIGDGNPEA